ncbi:MAG: amino acid adenylation domain-containing protein [Casimicrobiaceae bacterium]
MTAEDDVGGTVSSSRSLSLDARIALEQRLIGRIKGEPRPASIPRRSGNGACPASFAQAGLWMVEQISAVPGQYTIPHGFRIRGLLDCEALRAALDGLVARHDALRTRFTMRDGSLEQQVEPHRPFQLPHLDLRHRSGDDAKRAAGEFIGAIVHDAFDLAASPMLRAGLVLWKDDAFDLVIAVHHIAADGWSLGVLNRELGDRYEALRGGRSPELSPLPIQYCDYAAWQRATVTEAFLGQHLPYWRKHLAGIAALELPADRSRPTLPSHRGDVHRFRVPAPLTAGVKRLAHANGVTLFMTLLTAFQVLLMRYTGRDDIVISTPMAGRDRPELEELVGLFINTLVIRGDLSGNPTATELLARTRAHTLAAFAHRGVPFERLVEELCTERDRARNPLFQVMFALQNTPTSPLALTGVTVEPTIVDHRTAKCDLSLVFRESGDELQGSIEYATDLFDAASIARIAKHLHALLAGLVAAPDTPIGHLPILDDAERKQVVGDWNKTEAPYPADASLAQVVELRVEASPDAIAVECPAQTLTYAALNAQSNRLARHLRALGVGPGAIVGLLIERCATMVMAMLAVLKAGGAYLPLDPDYPEDRLRFMLDDAKSRLVLRQSNVGAWLRSDGMRSLDLDADPAPWNDRADTNLPPLSTSEDLAYVMYTSGSTGSPKGVLVPHRGIARLVLNTDYIHLDATDCVAQVSNPAFDAATFEIWGALANGARLAILPRAVTLDPSRLVAALQSRGITTLFLTTALFNEMVRARPDGFAGLKQLLFGGEVANPQRVTECLRAGGPNRLLHVYGPTETTTFATWHEVAAGTQPCASLPIGRPIANTTAYVLDGRHEPVPIGVPGELYIGGPGVARGYLGRPELTQQRFIPDRFSDRPDARLYRTGDRVRYRPDGNLEFLGRLDNQIKLRGHRIEPGEIEAVLAREPRVRAVAVVLRADVPEDPRLVAYVVTEPGGPAPDELRARLKQQLPGHMVPAAIVLLPSLPLNPSGKVDRAALPSPPPDAVQKEATIIAPRDNIERHLVRIWEVVLRRTSIGVRENFFELGGHSLLALQVMDEIEKAFQRRLPLDVLWIGGGTIETLATMLRNEYRAGPNPELVAIKGGSRRPLFVVHTMGGNLFHYYELARHLHADQGVYGLQARGVFGPGRPDRRVEAIAEHCVASLRAAQPRGPYLVAGFSSGGVVAYEIAQQLHAAGETVGMLALLDTFAPRRMFGRNWLAALPKHVRRRNLRATQEIAYFSVLHAMRLDRFRVLRSVGEAHRWAHWAYRPTRYERPITFFVAQESAARASADCLGWAPWLGGGSRIHPLPGRHGDIVKRPVVAELAAQLQACIDRAESG